MSESLFKIALFDRPDAVVFDEDHRNEVDRFGLRKKNVERISLEKPFGPDLITK